MKKLLLATAVAALSVTAAQAAPTVYGKAFLTLDYEQDGRTQLNSNGSRVGFKGAEALTTNTDLVYQLEYGVDIDANDNGDGQFYSRDTYLGLANKQFGTLLAGRLTAIDGMVDYANVAQGGVLGGDNVKATFDAPRANNALAYVSPNYSGVKFLGMYVMDEGGLVERDMFGAGVQFEPQSNFRAGASYIQAGDEKYTRVSGAFDLTPATTVGALYQNGTKGGEKENAFTLSATHKHAQTPWTVYGQLDLVDNYGYAKDAEYKRFLAGGKYAFSQATTGHIYAAVEDEGDNTFGIGGGIEHKF